MGAQFDLAEAVFIGLFEHYYVDDCSGDDFSTHHAALGYEPELGEKLLEVPTVQHDVYRWFLLMSCWGLLTFCAKLLILIDFQKYNFDYFL